MRYGKGSCKWMGITKRYVSHQLPLIPNLSTHSFGWIQLNGKVVYWVLNSRGFMHVFCYGCICVGVQLNGDS
jgi:hypothetical protein